MNMLRVKHRSLAVSALMLIAFACAANAEEYVKTYPVAHRADVRIHADESSIHVITSDSNQVEFRVRSEGIAALQFGQQVHVDSHQSGDEVELTVKVARGITIGFNNRTLKTEVHMPRNADLLIDTHDGAVEVASIDGNITIRTKDGAIKASQLSGHIELNTGDGGINVDGLKGESRLHTGDGSVDLLNIDGKLQAASGDGSIHVEGRFDSLDISSGDGSVSARVARGSRMSSPWKVRTKDGSVRLALPPDLQANLDVSTRDGHIASDLPVTVHGDIGRSQVQGTLNGGGPLLTVHTGDGAIRLNGT
jgi:hypothetical protein